MTHPLTSEFTAMQGRIALRERAWIAIAAHLETRAALHASEELVGHGLADVLIGSYARKVSIWPGKDVDVFGRLSRETVDSIDPGAAYAKFHRALLAFERQGRLTTQPRSLKVAYGPNRQPAAEYVREAGAEYGWDRSEVERVARTVNSSEFEFSVDVVPAVGWQSHYGIPEVGHDPGAGVQARTGEWRRTNPVELTRSTQALNQRHLIGGRGAYVPTVKAVKQVKSYWLAGTKPSALYYEFILHEGFTANKIVGSTWAELTASALDYIARRLSRAAHDPVCDPILAEAYLPEPDHNQLALVGAKCDELSARAQRAIAADARCQAAIEWRGVFGENAKHGAVFRLPPECRGDGTERGAAAAVATAATGGTAERSFGGR